MLRLFVLLALLTTPALATIGNAQAQGGVIAAALQPDRDSAPAPRENGDEIPLVIVYPSAAKAEGVVVGLERQQQAGSAPEPVTLVYDDGGGQPAGQEAHPVPTPDCSALCSNETDGVGGCIGFWQASWLLRGFVVGYAFAIAILKADEQSMMDVQQDYHTHRSIVPEITWTHLLEIIFPSIFMVFDTALDGVGPTGSDKDINNTKLFFLSLTLFMEVLISAGFLKDTTFPMRVLPFYGHKPSMTLGWVYIATVIVTSISVTLGWMFVLWALAAPPIGVGDKFLGSTRKQMTYYGLELLVFGIVLQIAQLRVQAGSSPDQHSMFSDHGPMVLGLFVLVLFHFLFVAVAREKPWDTVGGTFAYWFFPLLHMAFFAILQSAARVSFGGSHLRGVCQGFCRRPEECALFDDQPPPIDGSLGFCTNTDKVCCSSYCRKGRVVYRPQLVQERMEAVGGGGESLDVDGRAEPDSGERKRLFFEWKLVGCMDDADVPGVLPVQMPTGQHCPVDGQNCYGFPSALRGDALEEKRKAGLLHFTIYDEMHSATHHE